MQSTQAARNDNVQNGHIIVGRRSNSVRTSKSPFDARILTPTRSNHRRIIWSTSEARSESEARRRQNETVVHIQIRRHRRSTHRHLMSRAAISPSAPKAAPITKSRRTRKSNIGNGCHVTSRTLQVLQSLHLGWLDMSCKRAEELFGHIGHLPNTIRNENKLGNSKQPTETRTLSGEESMEGEPSRPSATVLQ